MKINWEMFLTVALAVLVVLLVDKFVLSKIGNFESYDEDDELESELY